MILIVISHPTFLPGETDLLKALFEAGLTRFHLRKPEAKKDDLRQFLQKFNEEELSKVVVHGFQDLAKEIPIGGIHFREAAREKQIDECQKFRPTSPMLKEDYAFTVSTSVHDLRSFSDLSEEFDYAFISPVFDSISKKGYANNPEIQSTLGARRSDIKLVALGGVDANRIASIKKWGYDGAAVLGAIWSNPDDTLSAFMEIQIAVAKKLFITR